MDQTKNSTKEDKTKLFRTKKNQHRVIQVLKTQSTQLISRWQISRITFPSRKKKKAFKSNNNNILHKSQLLRKEDKDSKLLKHCPFPPKHIHLNKLTMPANLENSAVATGLEKVSFHSNPKERQCQRMLKLPHNCTHLTH